MDLTKLRIIVAAPLASLFVVLLLCMLAVGRQDPSVGIRIPMMRLRPSPLTNCEFNGFTVYLRSDGKLAGGARDSEVPQEVLLHRIKEARDNIQDQTIFVVTDPDASFGQFIQLIAGVHNVAPQDHLAVVLREAQVQPFFARSQQQPVVPIWADRCRFEWPAVKGQPKWPDRGPVPLPLGRMSVWEALTKQEK